jgi:hypothetical protein
VVVDRRASIACSIRSTTQQLLEKDGYPPYDIVRTGEESFRISVALAGFTPDDIAIDDIAITAQQNLVTLAGRRSDAPEADSSIISARLFPRPLPGTDRLKSVTTPGTGNPKSCRAPIGGLNATHPFLKGSNF